MNVLDLVTERCGWQFDGLGGSRPIRRLRWGERLWLRLRYLPGNLWFRWRASRVPDWWVTPPTPRTDAALWFDGDIYGMKQRITVTHDREVGFTWLDIEEWTEERDMAVHTGPPRRASFMFFSDEFSEWLREVEQD